MEKEIPYGHCHCGCGNLTPIAQSSDKTRGWIKGQPIKFIRYHNWNLLRSGKQNGHWKGGRIIHVRGYIQIQLPNHPRANAGGYVFEHIVICEKALGKTLPADAEPHHVDGCKVNNKNYNLVVCQDHAYHMLLHQRARALRECGHASWRKCKYCKQYDDLNNLVLYQSKGQSAFHKICKNRYDKARYQRRLHG